MNKEDFCLLCDFSFCIDAYTGECSVGGCCFADKDFKEDIFNVQSVFNAP